MNFLDQICAAYGWQGIALVAIIIVLFAVQIYYYSIRYRRVPRY